jgi:hypothetical protein
MFLHIEFRKGKRLVSLCASLHTIRARVFNAYNFKIYALLVVRTKYI